MLKTYNKSMFHLFRRGQKIEYKTNTGVTLVTTVAQLNFFRWVVDMKILDYMDTEYNSIIEKLTLSEI